MRVFHGPTNFPTSAACSCRYSRYSLRKTLSRDLASRGESSNLALRAVEIAGIFAALPQYSRHSNRNSRRYNISFVGFRNLLKTVDEIFNVSLAVVLRRFELRKCAGVHGPDSQPLKNLYWSVSTRSILLACLLAMITL